MAAIIYRPGVHSLSAHGNGIQVGQWIFTGKPHVPASEAEIVHIDSVTFADTNPVAVANDSTFQGTLTEGIYQLDFDTDDHPEWNVGDILVFRGATSGNRELVGQTRSFRNGYSRNISATSLAGDGTFGNDMVVAFGHRFGDQLPQVGDIVFIGSTQTTVTGNSTIVHGTHGNFTHVQVDIQPSGGTQLSSYVGQTFHYRAEANVFIFEPDTFDHDSDPLSDEIPIQLSGAITVGNFSLEDEAEHLSFNANGHGNGPLYLTGGGGSLLIVPEGIEITANTLSA